MSKCAGCEGGSALAALELSIILIIIIIIEGLSLLQSIPPTTADKQTQAQKRRGSRSRKLLGAKAKSIILRPSYPMITRPVLLGCYGISAFYYYYYYLWDIRKIRMNLDMKC